MSAPVQKENRALSAGHSPSQSRSTTPSIWATDGAPCARAATVHALTADSDPSRLSGGMLRPASNRTSHPCESLAPDGWRCFEIAPGPFVVTDLRSTGTCKVAVAVAGPSAKLDSLRWVVTAPFDVHGSRLAADEGERLFIAVEGAAVLDEKNPYKVDTKGPECTVLWAGFLPYQKETQKQVAAPAQAEPRDDMSVTIMFSD